MSKNTKTFRAERMTAVVNLHEEFEALKKGSVIASREFVKNMAEQTVKEAKHKVGIKTGATKQSIRVIQQPKYTRAVVGADSWLDAWLKNGGGRWKKDPDSVAHFSERDVLNMQLYNKRAYRKYHFKKYGRSGRTKIMLKSHPAYYLLRPAKNLMRSVKSQKTYERYMRKYAFHFNYETKKWERYLG